MKDKEARQSSEQRFVALSEEIAMQLKKTSSPEFNGQYTNIIKRETGGGTRALTLSSEGKWGGRVQMMGWEIGTNPDIDRVISEYASVSDESYRTLELDGDWVADMPKREEYIRDNRERLFGELLTDMESTLKRIQGKPPMDGNNVTSGF